MVTNTKPRWREHLNYHGNLHLPRFVFFESADASENPNLVYTAIKGQVAAMDRIVIAVKTTAENRPRIGLYAARGANWFQPSLDVAVQAQITYRCSHFVATFLQVSNSRPEMTKDGVNDLLYFVLSEVLLGADICTPDRVEFCFLEHDTSAAHARNDTIRYQVHQCLSDSLPHVLREKLRCGDFRDLLDSLYPVLSYANKKEEESERNGSSLDHFKKTTDLGVCAGCDHPRPRRVTKGGAIASFPPYLQRA